MQDSSVRRVWKIRMKQEKQMQLKTIDAFHVTKRKSRTRLLDRKRIKKTV